MQNFSAGKALSDAFAIFKARFVPMVIVTVVYFVVLGVVFGTIGTAMLAPMLASAATGQPADPGALMAGMGGGIVLLYLVIYALNFWQQGAMCRLTSDRHDGNLGDAINAGLRAILPLFGVAIILLVAMMVFMLVFGLLVGGAAAGTGSSALGTILGLLALGAAIFFGLRLSMILPVIAIEDVRNPLAAMSRSWAMTKGHALKLFLTFALMVIVMVVVAVTIVSLTLGTSVAAAMAEGGTPGFGAIIAFLIGMLAFGLSVGIYFMAVIGAIHRQLGGESVAEVEATFA